MPFLDSLRAPYVFHTPSASCTTVFDSASVPRFKMLGSLLYLHLGILSVQSFSTWSTSEKTRSFAIMLLCFAQVMDAGDITGQLIFSPGVHSQRWPKNDIISCVPACCEYIRCRELSRFVSAATWSAFCLIPGRVRQMFHNVMEISG